jgi:hypothetical protein
MSEIEDRQEISAFLKRRKAKIAKVQATPLQEITPKPTPWYRRPLQSSEFRYKLAKDGNYYVRHKEWGRTTWIGPYEDMTAAETVIQSYVVESLKDSLDKKVDSSVHSIIIDNPEEFF